jgi:hypothetical protein
VLSVAKEQGIDTNAAAVMMADAASLLPHPITGHRCALFLELLGCVAMTLELSEDRSSFNGLSRMAGQWAPVIPFRTTIGREDWYHLEASCHRLLQLQIPFASCIEAHHYKQI